MNLNFKADSGAAAPATSFLLFLQPPVPRLDWKILLRQLTLPTPLFLTPFSPHRVAVSLWATRMFYELAWNREPWNERIKRENLLRANTRWPWGLEFLSQPGHDTTAHFVYFGLIKRRSEVVKLCKPWRIGVVAVVALGAVCTLHSLS